MSTETTKIQKLIDDQAQKQADQEAIAFTDLVIDYLSSHRHHELLASGAIRYGEHGYGSNRFPDKRVIRATSDFAVPFGEALVKFVSEWKKERFKVLQSDMTNDLLKKVNLLNP